MTAFFQFLLLMFVAAFVLIGLFIYRVYKQIHHAARQFKSQMDGTAQQQQSRRNGTYGDQETVVDNRDPEVANQKIFTEDEGEYVDFKEEE